MASTATSANSRITCTTDTLARSARVSAAIASERDSAPGITAKKLVARSQPNTRL
jgi:hypothetical protein